MEPIFLDIVPSFSISQQRVSTELSAGGNQCMRLKHTGKSLRIHKAERGECRSVLQARSKTGWFGSAPDKSFTEASWWELTVLPMLAYMTWAILYYFKVSCLLSLVMAGILCCSSCMYRSSAGQDIVYESLPMFCTS